MAQGAVSLADLGYGVGHAVMSVVLICGMVQSVHGTWGQTKDFFTWIDAGSFKVSAGFFFDPLTAVMLCVVTGIGFLITVYAAGYMKGEKGYFRFFAYLGLFIFMMTILVMGNNFIMLYLGWEGVGMNNDSAAPSKSSSTASRWNISSGSLPSPASCRPCSAKAATSPSWSKK